MAQKTQPYSRSFSGTVGSGFGAVFGSGKPYYMLEHKDTSRYYRKGQTQSIIVDQALLGRDSSCQVRFDDATFPTVSRRHAVIVRDIDQWKLIHLSEINPTFVNGEKVIDFYYLQNGDEIQLSAKGPRLGFILPTKTGDGTTNNLRLTERMESFWAQAVLPYKRALVAIVIILLLLIGGFLAWEWYSNKKDEEHFAKIESAALDNLNNLLSEDARLSARIDNALDEIHKIDEKLSTALDTLAALPQQLKHERDSLWKAVNILINKTRTKISKSGKTGSVITGVDNPQIDACSQNVFYIRTSYVELKRPNGNVWRIADEDIQWSGTAFLLTDGRLVTARHIVEPWMTKSILLRTNRKCPKCEEASTMKYLQFIKAAKECVRSGGRIIVHFTAVSPAYMQGPIEFTNEDFQVNRRSDVDYGVYTNKKYLVDEALGNDWAYIRTNLKGGLTIDPEASETLDRGVNLTILGYPFGMAAKDEEIMSFTPILSTAITAAKGLTSGIILTTNSSFEQGCSGGPVFYTDKDGNLIVIGLISSQGGRSQGYVVPISSLY